MSEENSMDPAPTHPAPTHPAPIHLWVSERLDAGVRRALDRLARADDVRHVAVMPDVHESGDICVGTAFATRQLVYPDAVGGDIGCGMAAVALSTATGEPAIISGAARARQQDALRLMQALRGAVPIARHRHETAEALASSVPAPDGLSHLALQKLAADEGAYQLGTLGRGNHFLELQQEDDGQLWLMVHSGSRGMGQAIRAHHLRGAQRTDSGLAHLDCAAEGGRAYLQDMHWARQFAAASRRAMLLATGRAVLELFGWQLLEPTLVDCDHNHVNQEQLLGGTLLVHRKGTVPAGQGVTALVPGSMAAASFHVRGRGVEEALCSSAHGAGRAMSRTEARSRVTRDRLARELRDVFVDPRVLGGLREEAPSAYKDIRDVMKAQRELVSVQRVLRPILTHKGH